MPNEIADAPAHRLIEQIRSWKQERYDVVERTGKLKLPLVLDKDDEPTFNRAFECARSELSVCYADEARDADLRTLLVSVFDPSTVKSHFQEGEARRTRINLFKDSNPGLLIKRRIIGLAYPWFNQQMYLDLAKITRRINIQVDSYSYLEGNYRYFRSYPEPAARFRLSDGFFSIKLDTDRNMIVFGQTTRLYRDFGDIKIGDPNNTIYEYRGFVFPTNRSNVLFLSFREGVIRYGIIETPPENGESHGVILSETKQNHRPFAAKAIIAKQGSSAFYDIPIRTLAAHPYFLDPSDGNYERVEVEMERLSKSTMFEEKGFMWGLPDFRWGP